MTICDGGGPRPARQLFSRGRALRRGALHNNAHCVHPSAAAAATPHRAAATRSTRPSSAQRASRSTHMRATSIARAFGTHLRRFAFIVPYRSRDTRCFVLVARSSFFTTKNYAGTCRVGGKTLMHISRCPSEEQCFCCELVRFL